jgi:hypothetical protein
VFRDDVAGALGKNPKQPVFNGHQFKSIPVEIYQTSVKIYGESADGDPALASGRAQIGSYRAAGPHQEVIHLEGLDKVIVGTKPRRRTLPATLDRADGMITGTRDEERRRSRTLTPDMSGRSRSRVMRTGE